jgi:hypothetical protein
MRTVLSQNQLRHVPAQEDACYTALAHATGVLRLRDSSGNGQFTVVIAAAHAAVSRRSYDFGASSS